MKKTYATCYMNGDMTKILKFADIEDAVSYATERGYLSITDIDVYDSETDEFVGHTDDIVRDDVNEDFIFTMYCVWDHDKEGYLGGWERFYTTYQEALDAAKNAPQGRYSIDAVSQTLSEYLDTIDRDMLGEEE